MYEKDAVSKPAAEAVTETMTVPDGFYGFYTWYDTFYFYDFAFYDYVPEMAAVVPAIPEVGAEFVYLDFLP